MKSEKYLKMGIDNQKNQPHPLKIAKKSLVFLSVSIK